MRSTINQQLQTMESIGGVKFVSELAQLFVTECSTRFSEIEAFLAEGNLCEAGKLFHQVQGSSASIGATRLRYICASGEEACLKANPEQAARCYELGAREMSRVIPFFEDWKKA